MLPDAFGTIGTIGFTEVAVDTGIAVTLMYGS
jgi:hypothetical protein